MPENTKDVFKRIKKAIIEDDPTAASQIYGLENGVCYMVLNPDYAPGKTKKTLLHIAAEKGNVEACRALIMIGASEMELDADGHNVFWCACAAGNIECAKLFVEEHIIELNKADANGVTALDAIADPDKKAELVRYIESICGRDWDKNTSSRSLTESWNSTIKKLSEDIIESKPGVSDDLKKAVAAGFPINMENAQFTLLLDAIGEAGYSNLDAINTLIDLGADMNRQSWEGYSPFCFACYMGAIPAAKLLVDRGARVDIPVFKDDDGIRSPLEVLEIECGEDVRKDMEEYIMQRRGFVPEDIVAIFPEGNDEYEDMEVMDR